MIKSMTGYGKTAFTIDGKSIVMEIRSLNSKQLDLNTRIVPYFRDKENEIRSYISNKLERGKIEFYLFIEKSENPTVTIDFSLAKAYFQTLKELSDNLENKFQTDIFSQVLKMPDVISSPKEEISEVLWLKTLEVLEETCEKVNSFRLSEGAHLAPDFEKRITLIQNLREKITPFEKSRIETIRSNFIKHLSELSDDIQYNACRLEEELLYYLEKSDITEEKIRLDKHCSYFLETMNESVSNGKKLGFILQEIGREINTLGAKANDFNIQQIVVRMKDELEKMKEQIANIL